MIEGGCNVYFTCCSHHGTARCFQVLVEGRRAHLVLCKLFEPAVSVHIASAPICFRLLSAFARGQIISQRFMDTSSAFPALYVLSQQAVSSFHAVDMAATAVFEPQGDVKVLTKLLGVSEVQSPSIFRHTAQACKLHCPPVLVTQVNDSHITLLATDSFSLFH